MMQQATTNSSDLAAFASQLTAELDGEYSRILAPYGLASHASALAAGRQIRSRLAAVTAGQLSDRLIRRCVALELLHTSTLIHDDIMDKGTVRRGVPTLWKSVGFEQALLIGNLASTRALAIAHADSFELADAFIKAFRQVNVAQLRESHERGRIKARATQEAINDGKTSAMLELGLIVGCLSSAPHPVDDRDLRCAIREFGAGFQLADDVEDIEAWLGKSGQARSKTADFDVELGNFTMALTLLIESAGKGHQPGDPLSLQTLQAFGRHDWESGLVATVDMASDHFRLAQGHLDRALESSGDAELARRVANWTQQMIDSWRKKGLDATLSGLPQQEAAQ
ncbi:hypothetical protein E1263_06385 [Kribbella antibiotica]|uniref:Polyprenyl synthetase family protein n=1 Tax=Kribbella antibiotica TaxID=190195 RepID=A0A4R4ZUK0_9ACTN|nr:polyprenyl synthetase family protein [Kribbella antibiotica]TDD61659.1 hypothetical protein E1263_06385 [Kribbella antibiotica]